MRSAVSCVKRTSTVSAPASAAYRFTSALASQNSRGTRLLLVALAHSDDVTREQIIFGPHTIGDHELSCFLGRRRGIGHESGQPILLLQNFAQRRLVGD